MSDRAVIAWFNVLMLVAGSCLLGEAFENWMVGAGFACLAIFLRPDT